MTPERWAQIEKIFGNALALSPSKREQFVTAACREDSGMRLEVASLLASHERAGDFLEVPALPDAKIHDAISVPTGLTFLPDQVVAERFKILRFIAEGGMGEVYEAFDQDLQEHVALKTVRLTMAMNEEAESRFMREILLARRVTHPNVCRIFDVFRHKVESGNFEGEVRFLTMELLSGETLGKRLRRVGRMPSVRVRAIAEQIAGAVGAAHDAGIIHRDLKPDNVMLVPWKRGVRAVVTDFGLARGVKPTQTEPLVALTASRESLLWTLHGFQAGSAQRNGALRRLARRARRHMAAFGLIAPVNGPLTEAGRVLGTPDYMSPEQARGARADERTDIWSYGVLLYELLTGELPYRRESSWARFLRRRTGRKPSPGKLRKVPCELRRIVERCLELERSARYEGFDEILDDLRRSQDLKLEPAWLARHGLSVLAIAVSILALVVWYFLSR